MKSQSGLLLRILSISALACEGGVAPPPVHTPLAERNVAPPGVDERPLAEIPEWYRRFDPTQWFAA